MKIRNLAVTLVVLALSLAQVKGATVAPTYPMGSPEILTNYCVGKVTYLETVFYFVTNNVSHWIDERQLNRTFSSKQELDLQARAWAEEMVNNYLATNGSTAGQFKISVSGLSARQPFATMLGVIYLFTFSQSRDEGSQNLVVPSLSGISTRLLSQIPYHAPGVTRAIMQIWNGENWSVSDSKKTSDIQISFDGIMRVKTSYLLQPGWTIELATIASDPKSYAVYNHFGHRRPEIQPNLSLSRVGGQYSLSVSNVEAGRVYKVEQSTNLVHWTTNSFVFEGSYRTKGAYTNFSNVSSGPKSFFRVTASDSWLP